MVVVQFLVPFYNRAGRPYPRSVHQGIQRELEERFDGWSLAANQPLPGAWRNPATGHVEHDESWRYEVGVHQERLAELEDYFAMRLGQKAIWRVAYGRGEGKAVNARPTD